MTRASVCLALSIVISGCGTSTARRTQVVTAVNQFATEWQANDIHRMYDRSHEQFRRRFSFDDYSRWLASVQQSWGRLEKIQVRSVERSLPMNDVYQAQVDFEHEKGASRGSLTFIFDGNTPRLVGTVLDDGSRHPTS